MSDIFAEQLVVKKSSSADNARRVMIAVGSVFICLAIVWLAFWYIIYLLAALPFTILYQVRLFRSVFTEYEYSVTNGEIDVIKITGKSKRVALITAELKDVYSFAKFNKGDADRYDTVIAAHDRSGQGAYRLSLKNPKYGDTIIILSPDKRILSAVNAFVPKAVKLEGISDTE
ncbi:MAG: hypothetical protein LBN42_02340 [Oscillospiraceae bacterium]|jgi:hypothetical protein|nr:hypothetical protein [Oscillospiraceae bacterium]